MLAFTNGMEVIMHDARNWIVFDRILVFGWYSIGRQDAGSYIVCDTVIRWNDFSH
jgi:hypothetical protein